MKLLNADTVSVNKHVISFGGGSLDILEVFKEAGITGQLILVPLLFYGAWIVGLRVFSDATNWTTPFETRRRNRVKLLDERLSVEQDADLKAVLEDQRKALVFQETTGILTVASRRHEFIQLQRRCGHRFGWTDIKKAIPHLQFNDQGRLRKHISLFARLFMGLFLALTFLFIGLALYVGLFIQAPTNLTPDASLAYPLAQLLAQLFLLGLAMLAVQPAIPIIRAIQLQRWILEENVIAVAQTAGALEEVT